MTRWRAGVQVVVGERREQRRRWVRVAVYAAVGALTLLVVLAVWRWGAAVVHLVVPMTQDGWEKVDEAVRIRAEGQFRLAVVQFAVAVGGVVALLYTARNYRLSRRGQVTDRFTKALERLGSGEMYVRIGGILALEQIVVDSPDQATHAAQVLNAFIRDRTPRPPLAGVRNRRRLTYRPLFLPSPVPKPAATPRPTSRLTSKT